MQQVTRRLILSAAAAAWLPPAPVAHPQAFPRASRPIQVVVPYAPGGSSDFLARLVAKKLGENLNHNVVVENKPGASTIIGADYVAKSKPDGYTIYLIGELTHSSLAPTNAKLPFDPLKDFAPITNLVESPLVISVPPAFPASSLKEFVNHAKANPGAVNYGSAGLGNTLHLAAEQFAKTAGVQMNHVQYKGASAAIIDLLAGRIDVMFDLPQTPLPHIEAGKLKALAVTSKNRLPMLPQVPTTSEAGFPNYQFTTRIGMSAPAGTPEPVMKKLHAELLKVMQDPQVKRSLEEKAMLVFTNASPQEYQKQFADSAAMTKDLLAGVKRQ